MVQYIFSFPLSSLKLISGKTNEAEILEIPVFFANDGVTGIIERRDTSAEESILTLGFVLFRGEAPSTEVGLLSLVSVELALRFPKQKKKVINSCQYTHLSTEFDDAEVAKYLSL